MAHPLSDQVRAGALRSAHTLQRLADDAALLSTRSLPQAAAGALEGLYIACEEEPTA